MGESTEAGVSAVASALSLTNLCAIQEAWGRVSNTALMTVRPTMILASSKLGLCYFQRSFGLRLGYSDTNPDVPLKLFWVSLKPLTSYAAIQSTLHCILQGLSRTITTLLPAGTRRLSGFDNVEFVFDGTNNVPGLAIDLPSNDIVPTVATHNVSP